MFNIKSIFQTLITTKNFWVALYLSVSKKKATVIFRNGCKAELSLLEYHRALNILIKGYVIEHFDGKLSFKKGRVRIIGPLSLLNVLCENLDEIYSIDCRNKTVLDIGGFIGESAIFFSAAGAAKVIIYEPVVTNHEFIKMNMVLDNVNAELHDEGIGETDGCTLIHYDKIDTSFGLTDSGANELSIRIKSVRRAIEESYADIAKFDCEGAEIALDSVPPEVLRSAVLNDLSNSYA